MREADLIVNDVPWTHSDQPTINTHTIQHSESEMVIELQLDRIFLVFKSRKPTNDDLHEGIPIVITLEGKVWDPHSDSYANNESSFLDHIGNTWLREQALIGHRYVAIVPRMLHHNYILSLLLGHHVWSYLSKEF